MAKKKFGLIGDGYIAKYHKAAVGHVGGEIIGVYDPVKSAGVKLDCEFYKQLDWVIIASPSYFHYRHILHSLKHDVDIIVEKPAFLPWEPIINDSRINIVMQLREIEQTSGIGPFRWGNIEVQMVRDENYMDGWKGNPDLTGGFIFNLFIHYIDLAIRNKVHFEGRVIREGRNIRRIGDLDLAQVEMQTLYNSMYEAILSGHGTKPENVFKLYWVMQQMINRFGIGDFYRNYTFEGI